MKKLLLVISMLLSINYVNAQNEVDDFNVGPYEVYYKGKGDVNFRLKKGVDLYEYFGLKKDTIIQVSEVQADPLKHGFQVSFLGETSTSRYNFSMLYALEGVWKQKISSKTYFNGGLSLGYAVATNSIKEDVFEIGIPLSIEWANINQKKASLYCGIGLIPTYYTTLSSKYVSNTENGDPEKVNGLYISPKLDLGGYIPVGKQIVKIGVTFRYKVNCSTKDADIYKDILGRAFVGANIGIIL